MSGFVVDVGDVRSAANSVVGVTDDLRDGLHRVETLAADVFTVGWSGVAAAAYQRAWDEWRDSARAVLAVLAETGEALERTAAGYATHEQAAITGLERIAS